MLSATRRHLVYPAIFFGLFVHAPLSGADEGEKGKLFSGAITATAQSSSDSRAGSEVLYSVDIETVYVRGAHSLKLYLETSSRPRSGKIASLIGEANADAGSALDGNGDQRLQISGFSYSRATGFGRLTAGVLDLTSWFDTSDVANSETTQFINADFVNNPAIAFPDYTVALYVEHKLKKYRYGWRAAIAGSHGLGDNPGRKYSELFDLNESGEGQFVIGEVFWPVRNPALRIGAWYSSADHVALAGAATDRSNSGLYLGLDYKRSDWHWNLRGGIADKRVSETAWFASIAAVRRKGGNALGLAAGFTGMSSHLAGPGRDDRFSAEVFYRYKIKPPIGVTVSLQHIVNSGFDSSGLNFDRRQNIATIRLHYEF